MQDQREIIGQIHQQIKNEGDQQKAVEVLRQKGIEEKRAEVVAPLVSKIIEVGGTPMELSPLLLPFSQRPDIQGIRKVNLDTALQTINTVLTIHNGKYANITTPADLLNSLPETNYYRPQLESAMKSYLQEVAPTLVGEPNPDIVKRFRQFSEFQNRIVRGEPFPQRFENQTQIQEVGQRIAAIMDKNRNLGTIINAVQTLEGAERAELVTAMADMLRAQGQEIPPTLFPATIKRMYEHWSKEKQAERNKKSISNTIEEPKKAIPEQINKEEADFRESQQRIHQFEELQKLPASEIQKYLPLNFRVNWTAIAQNNNAVLVENNSVISYTTASGSVDEMRLLNPKIPGGFENVVYETIFNTPNGELPVVVKLRRPGRDGIPKKTAEILNTRDALYRQHIPEVVPSYSYTIKDPSYGERVVTIQPKITGKLLDPFDRSESNKPQDIQDSNKDAVTEIVNKVHSTYKTSIREEPRIREFRNGLYPELVEDPDMDENGFNIMRYHDDKGRLIHSLIIDI